MGAEGGEERAALDAAALAEEVVDGVAVRDGLDLLLDDGPLVEVGRGVVGRGADEL